MKTLEKFLYLLSHQERKRIYLLLVMILIMALLDMLGVASIMPFIAVLTNPELIENAAIQQLWKNYENNQHKNRATFTKSIV